MDLALEQDSCRAGRIFVSGVCKGAHHAAAHRLPEEHQSVDGANFMRMQD